MTDLYWYCRYCHVVEKTTKHVEQVIHSHRNSKGNSFRFYLKVYTTMKELRGENGNERVITEHY